MKKLSLFLLLLITGLSLRAQFAPRDGWAGSTAFPKDSSVFITWAVSAQVERGWKDIRFADSGKVNTGTEQMAAGAADGQTVSLGDGGRATLAFNPPIVDGPGADFAVFENGFHIRNNSDSDFLELAFVEVSSDGQKWVRFPAQSANDTNIQLATFDGSKASKVHNLAGKYTSGFGTPFDLAELSDSTGLDLMAIRYVRVIDVVGSLDDQLCSRDALGNKINDPFPTPFNQGGFDLDAVGVIYNQHSPNGLERIRTFVPYPNPCRTETGIRIAEEDGTLKWSVFDLSGKQLREGSTAIAAKGLRAGTYFIRYTVAGSTQSIRFVVQ